jgi:hypothetical protein
VITDVTPDLSVSGPGPGIWYYRVSAVMGAGDPENPLGETLPSDPQPVEIPPDLAEPLEIALTWSRVTGASGYRVYRSPAADLASGNEELLATLAGEGSTSFVDAGDATTPERPRQIGDLGQWAAMPALSTAREGLGLGLGRDPVASDTYYVYAAGGRTTDGTTPRAYELLSIVVGAGGSHTVAPSWSGDAGNTIANGRWEMGVFTVDDVATTRITRGDTWIYLGPGWNANETVLVTDVTAARVQAGGLLTAWQETTTPPTMAGYGLAAAANQLFAFGGRNGVPSANGRSAQICGLGLVCNGGPPDPPDLRNWNALPNGLLVARYLMGSAVESGHIFLVGGQTIGSPTPTVESVVW